MSEQIVLQTPEVNSSTITAPYPPSWVDRLQVWVDRLPVAAWLFYALIGLLLVFGFAWVEWQAGQYPVGTLFPIHVFIMGAGPFALALIYYLDHYAHTALTRFRPALIVDAEQEALLLYRLTTLPARPTLYATLAGAGLAAPGFLIPAGQQAQLYGYADTPISAVFYMSIYVLLNMIAGAFIYHIVHQLREINLIYTQHTRINLFHHRQLYALAWLSAFTAIGLTLGLFTGLASAPSLSGTAALIQWSIGIPILLIPVVIFLWPLLGIHRLLAAEKERLLDANQSEIERTLQEIHESASAKRLDDIGRLNQLLESLQTEDRLLKQIPTWPWQPAALRSVIATVLLPLVIWLAQQLLLQRFVP